MKKTKQLSQQDNASALGQQSKPQDDNGQKIEELNEIIYNFK